MIAMAQATPADDPATPLRVAMLTGSISASAGGVSEALRHIGRTMNRTPGLEIEVFTPDRDDTTDPLAWQDVPVRLMPLRGPRSFGYSPGFATALRDFDPHLVHVHGLWMYQSVAARRWHARTGRPYLVSPHGMLDRWALANRGWKKTVARKLYEDAHLRHAACLHALCRPEAEAIRDLGLAPPVCVIPNGVEMPTAPSEAPAWRQKLPANARILLYLGRAHPKKGVTELVRAWAARAREGIAAAWHLAIVGPGDPAYVDQLKMAATNLGGAATIHFIGPLYGPEKTASFAAADAFILPSFSEGLPIAPLEAWAHGLPALLTPQCNLPEGFDRGAALRIAPEEAAIAEGIGILMTMTDDERHAMGEQGRALARDQFAWDAVARDLQSVYRWVLGQQQPPASVPMF